MDVVRTLGELLNTTAVFSTALILAAMGGIFSERSGIANIALEGLMIAGAFGAAVAGYYAEEAGFGPLSPWAGMLAAVALACLFALLHAVATVTFRADHIISGVVVNFLAAGLTLFLVKLLFEGAGDTPTLDEAVFRKLPVPLLVHIPIVGPGLFRAYPSTYLAFAAVALTWYVLYRRPFGLRLRAVGEHPGAADTVGVDVGRMRYAGVLLSGVLAGLGGATIALTTTSNFSHTTISGQGYIALAAMIFGKWNPLGALGAALFFGFAQGAVRNFVQLFEWARHIPNEFIYMLPYVLTIFVLAGAVGRARAPAAIGTSYEPGKR